MEYPIDINAYIPIFYFHNKEQVLPMNHENKQATPDTLSQTPIYYYFREEGDYYQLNIILLFHHNPPYMILGCLPKGDHPGDIEHCTILIRKDTQTIDRIFMGSHGQIEGSWIYSRELEWENGRPVVYVAKNSHALYWRSGVYFRVWFLANDYCGKNIKWNPPIKEISLQDDWIKHKIGTSQAIIRRSWMYAPEEYISKSRFWHRMKMIFRFK